MEYLFVMGFALLLALPLIILYFTQTAQLQDQVTSASIERAATQIVDAADTVYYLGAPSSRTITVDLPADVESVSFQGTSVTFTVSSSHGDYDQNGWSAANLTGSVGITKGPHTLVVTALPDGRVNVTEG